MVTMLASAARTASGDSGALTNIPHPEVIKRASFFLDVTVAATEVDDTLNVFIQTRRNDVWQDVALFTEVLGNGGVKQFVAEWSDSPAPETEQGPPQDVAISAGVVQGGKLGDQVRVKWVVVDPGGAAASFTFSVDGEWVRGRP